MTDPSPQPSAEPASTGTRPPAAPDPDVLASGEPDKIQAAIRASQQRLSEAVDDAATAVNPVNVAHRSADAVREDPRPVIAVAGGVVLVVVLLTVISRLRRRGGG